ncbi:hypothetical protein HBI12_213870 [Parastagonospora nodorum]|nr:hypothetical protein HBI12_213870 [Parastagonospora nodorum]KAH5397961.1 hypothetical protein HBI47_209540 [Parastagonospora nodorum]
MGLKHVLHKGPFGNVPANGTVVWKATPDVRGSFSILSTCVLTLLLCAYASLHLDIPQYGKTGWSHRAWKKVQWVCIGLCAPEFVRYSGNTAGCATLSVIMLISF